MTCFARCICSGTGPYLQYLLKNIFTLFFLFLLLPLSFKNQFLDFASKKLCQFPPNEMRSLTFHFLVVILLSLTCNIKKFYKYFLICNFKV